MSAPTERAVRSLADEAEAPVDDRPLTCAHGCPGSRDNEHKFSCRRAQVVLTVERREDGAVDAGSSR